tara:strand:+ start:11167 stop:13134 length:1968 start_codon:yes stop_codon:yes gene_type:complete
MSTEDEVKTAEREMEAMEGVTTNDKGCPEMPPDQPYNPEDSLEMAEKAAKAMGMDSECVEVAKNISDKKIKSESTNVVVVTPFGGGGGSNQQNETNTFTDTTMTKSGCQKISNTMNQMKMEQISMTCNMNSTLSEQSTTAIGSNTLKIETIPPSKKAIEVIEARTADLSENLRLANQMFESLSADNNNTDAITKLAIAGVQEPMYTTAINAINKILADKLDALQAIIDMNRQALDDYQNGNSLDASIIGSNIVQEIDSKMKLAASQTIDSSAKSAMKDSMKRLATSVALDKVNTDIGPGGARDAAREMITNQIDEKMKKEDRNIEETITKNSMRVESGNQVILSVKGNIVDSDISQAISSQVELTVQQSVKKSVEIGKELATEVITETVKENIDNRTGAGIDKVVEAAGANDAALVEATKSEGLGDIMLKTGEGVGAAAEGVGKGIGAAGEGLGKGVGAAGEGVGKGVGSAFGGAMIPLIIIGVLVIGGFFLLPKAGPMLAGMTGASPGTIKMVGGVLLAIIVACIVIFWVLPAFSGSKESRRRRRYEGRIGKDYFVNTPAPGQRMPPVNTQPIKSPYVRVEKRNFKGDRSARKIPSYKKISQYYRSPTQKVHDTSYNVNEKPRNISTVHNPTYHFHNKVEDNPVMYSKKSAYKY